MDQIDSPHGDLHFSMKCDMAPTDTAAYDTIFYLHHSYVDYQWAFWQELQKLRGHSDPTMDMPNEPLPPFDNDDYNDIQGNHNEDHGHN